MCEARAGVGPGGPKPRQQGQHKRAAAGSAGRDRRPSACGNWPLPWLPRRGPASAAAAGPSRARCRAGAGKTYTSRSWSLQVANPPALGHRNARHCHTLSLSRFGIDSIGHYLPTGGDRQPLQNPAERSTVHDAGALDINRASPSSPIELPARTAAPRLAPCEQHHPL